MYLQERFDWKVTCAWERKGVREAPGTGQAAFTCSLPPWRAPITSPAPLVMYFHRLVINEPTKEVRLHLTRLFWLKPSRGALWASGGGVSGEEITWPATLAAIWAWPFIGPLSSAGQDLSRESADASLSLSLHDSCHLLVICCCSGVRGFQRVLVSGAAPLRCAGWLPSPFSSSQQGGGSWPGAARAAMNIMILFFALERALYQVPAPS